MLRRIPTKWLTRLSWLAPETSLSQTRRNSGTLDTGSDVVDVVAQGLGNVILVASHNSTSRRAVFELVKLSMQQVLGFLGGRVKGQPSFVVTMSDAMTGDVPMADNPISDRVRRLVGWLEGCNDLFRGPVVPVIWRIRM